MAGNERDFGEAADNSREREGEGRARDKDMIWGRKGGRPADWGGVAGSSPLQGRIVSGMAYATKECYWQMLGVKKFIYWVDLTYSNDISWHDEQ